MQQSNIGLSVLVKSIIRSKHPICKYKPNSAASVPSRTSDSKAAGAFQY